MAKKTRKKEDSPESLGYPEIEKLIDSEDFDDVNRVFTAAHDDLSELHRKKKGLGKSRDAKKAMKAIELTMALFRELLGIKYNLQNQLKKAKTVAK